MSEQNKEAASLWAKAEEDALKHNALLVQQMNKLSNDLLRLNGQEIEPLPTAQKETDGLGDSSKDNALFFVEYASGNITLAGNLKPCASA